MYSISSSIEIAATPATVRDKFLDFSSISKYSPDGFIRSIAPLEENTSSHSLRPGDQLNISVGYGKFNISPLITENTPIQFSWKGSIPGFSGEHIFRFEEIPGAVTEEQSRTKFIHKEEFTGLLSFMMGQNIFANLVGEAAKAKNGFDGFNKDFKAWVEL